MYLRPVLKTVPGSKPSAHERETSELLFAED
jgi:hypothetical protein